MTGRSDNSPPPSDRSAGHYLPRSLPDTILIAFHQACDEDDLEVAEQLLRVLAMLLNRDQATLAARRRRSMGGLVAAYERLWQLRHPDRADEH